MTDRMLEVKMRHRAKFCGNQSTIAKIWQFMAILEMAAVCHSGCYEFEILSTDKA